MIDFPFLRQRTPIDWESAAIAMGEPMTTADPIWDCSPKNILQSLVKITRELKPVEAPPSKVIFSDLLAGRRPRMTLSERVSVTPEFRAEMNAWMLDFFGWEPPQSYVITDPVDGSKTLVLPASMEREFAERARSVIENQMNKVLGL